MPGTRMTSGALERCIRTVSVVALSFGAAIARADEPSDSRAATFQAVSGNAVQEISGGTLLLVAYATIFGLMLGYVLWLARIQSGVTKEILLLKSALERAAAKDRGR